MSDNNKRQVKRSVKNKNNNTEEAEKKISDSNIKNDDFTETNEDQTVDESENSTTELEKENKIIENNNIDEIIEKKISFESKSIELKLVDIQSDDENSEKTELQAVNEAIANQYRDSSSKKDNSKIIENNNLDDLNDENNSGDQLFIPENLINTDGNQPSFSSKVNKIVERLSNLVTNEDTSKITSINSSELDKKQIDTESLFNNMRKQNYTPFNLTRLPLLLSGLKIHVSPSAHMEIISIYDALDKIEQEKEINIRKAINSDQKMFAKNIAFKNSLEAKFQFAYSKIEKLEGYNDELKPDYETFKKIFKIPDLETLFAALQFSTFSDNNEWNLLCLNRNCPSNNGDENTGVFIKKNNREITYTLNKNIKLEDYQNIMNDTISANEFKYFNICKLANDVYPIEKLTAITKTLFYVHVPSFEDVIRFMNILINSSRIEHVLSALNVDFSRLLDQDEYDDEGNEVSSKTLVARKYMYINSIAVLIEKMAITKNKNDINQYTRIAYNIREKDNITGEYKYLEDESCIDNHNKILNTISMMHPDDLTPLLHSKILNEIMNYKGISFFIFEKECPKCKKQLPIARIPMNDLFFLKIQDKLREERMLDNEMNNKESEERLTEMEKRQ